MKNMYRYFTSFRMTMWTSFRMAVCLAAGLLIFSGEASAQGRTTVKGTVKDVDGVPIVGAAVMVEGTTTGVITDVDGKYVITFTPDSKKASALVFSSISYVNQTVLIGGRTIVDVVLEADAEQLEEVLVVGYGAMRKSDITGSVTSVKIDEDQAGRSASLDQLLQGQAAGVQVVSQSGAPDGAVNVTIRGASSFNISSQPLYVVDGIIMNTSGTVEMGTRGGTDAGIVEENNGLMGLSPQDIASMEILKDASATAIYGSQGANGVVLITTKSASRNKPLVTFTAGLNLSHIYKKYDLMDAEEYRTYLDMRGDVKETDSYYTIYTKDMENGTYVPCDWQDYVTRISVTQRYFLTISGRPKNTNYRFSIGCNDNQGVIKGTGYTNVFSRINLDKTIGRVKIGTKTSISWLDSDMTQTAGGTISQTPATSLVHSMLMTRPVRRVVEYDDEGLEMSYDDQSRQSGPDMWLSDYESKRNELRVIASIYGEVKILDWLSFKTTFGTDYRSNERTMFKSARINSQGTGSHGSVGHSHILNWNWDNLLQINKKIKKHRIMGTLGHSVSSSFVKSMTVEGTNVRQYKAMSASLNSAPYSWLRYSESQSQLLSFFARATYNYAERYIVTATYRFDGSSKFVGKNRWAQFPSFAAAWRISNEPWFRKVRSAMPWFTSAKLRVGWGTVGNQRIPSYQTTYRYSTTAAATHENDYHKLMALSSFYLPSENLKWETTSQYNAGLDLDFFKGRLVLAVDGYYKVTKDLLQTKVLAGSAGINNPYVNMGSISNTGFEITLNTVPVATKNWEWTLGGNFTLNRNKILSIDSSGANMAMKNVYYGEPQRMVEYFAGEKLSSSSINADYLNIFIKGEPMCLFYGLKTDGFIQEGEKVDWVVSEGESRGPGAVKFVDISGPDGKPDGLINTYDKVVIGDPNPDFTYGFNTSLKYKRFSLSASFVGSYGNDVYNMQLANLTDMTTRSANRLRAPVFDCWTPENKDARWPALSQAIKSTADLNLCSDRFVEDGSYLRLANASFSYSLPLKKDSFIKHLSFAVSGKNLFCWTRYSGYDPDVNVFGRVQKYGIDAGSYPAARTYMFDVKISF